MKTIHSIGAVSGLQEFMKQFPLKADPNDAFDLSVKSGKFKKRGVITPYNQPEKNIYFLKKGIVEFTLVGSEGNRIIDFYFPPSFFCALTSFVTQENSLVEIIALTDCEVDYVERDTLYKAYEHSLYVNKLGRVLIEEAYIKKFKREIDFLTKPAKARYEDLVRLRPNIAQEISVKKIAQYLGIHPESLSRIRKELAT